jgi:hypothetical protein
MGKTYFNQAELPEIRPGRALSELLQGGDPMRALLRGRATKPSLGYALFPEGQEKGFQAEDIAASADLPSSTTHR